MPNLLQLSDYELRRRFFSALDLDPRDYAVTEARDELASRALARARMRRRRVGGMTGPVHTARFVVLEGGDAAGKATQAARLFPGDDTLRLSFPRYGTDYGRVLQDLLAERLRVYRRSENPDAAPEPDDRNGARLTQALFHLDRCLAAPRVTAALQGNRRVVCDRWWMCSPVYAETDDLDGEEQLSLALAARVLPQPDAALYLDVPSYEAQMHLAARGRPRDRFEDAQRFSRVRRNYFRWWLMHGPTLYPQIDWLIVDATGTADEVFARVQEALK